MGNPIRLYPGISVAAVDDLPVKIALRAVDQFLRDVGPGIKQLSDSIATLTVGSFPGGASYATVLNESGTLPAARQIQATAPITLADGGAGTQISIGAAMATPSIGLGLVAAAGGSGTLIRSDATIAAFDGTTPADLALTAATGAINFTARRDHVHRFPTSLLSLTTLTTLALTDDGTKQILTGNFGGLTLTAGGSFVLDTTSAPTNLSSLMGVNIRPANSQFTGIVSNTFGGNLTSQTLAMWDARISGFSGILTGATVIGFNMSSFGITLSASSDTTNKVYGLRVPRAALATAASTGFTEGAAAYLSGVAGSLSTTVVTTGYMVKGEMPTAGSSDQFGIDIVDGLAGFKTTPTNRKGLHIAPMLRGTNRWGAHIEGRTQLESPLADAQTVLLLKQLNTGGAAGAHANLDDKVGDPTGLIGGDLWRNADSLKFYMGSRAARATLEQRVTEQDFGASPVNYGEWTISDGDVNAASHVDCWLTAEPPTGLDGDEADMEPMACYAENLGAGSFLLVAVPFDGPVVGKYKFGYQVA